MGQGYTFVRRQLSNVATGVKKQISALSWIPGSAHGKGVKCLPPAHQPKNSLSSITIFTFLTF